MAGTRRSADRNETTDFDYSRETTNHCYPLQNAIQAKIHYMQVYYFLGRLPICALKPVWIALTDLLDPQDMHDMKKILFSFVSRVSKDLHVLHVTYSTGHIQ